MPSNSSSLKTALQVCLDWRAVLCAVAFGLLFLSLSAFAQSSPPPLPSTFRDQAFFGCDKVTVSSSQVRGVAALGGAQGTGGHVASNGAITVSGGSGLVDGNATPGPGKTVTVSGGATVTGSTAAANSTRTCSDPAVGAWVSYAQANNNNSQIPAGYLNGSLDLTVSGSASLELTPGVYYLHKFTVSGGGTVTVTGPVTIVTTDKPAMSGGFVNAGGLPTNLLIVNTSGQDVQISGSVEVSLEAYSPLGKIAVSNDVPSYGTLWGKEVTESGGAVWCRLMDTAAPALSILQPAAGTTAGTATPAVSISFDDGAIGTGVVTSSLTVAVDGTSILSALTVTGAGASGTVPFALSEGSHTLTASVRDFEGNTASAQSTFNVQTIVDTTPPVISVAGVTEGGLYGAAVTPVVTVTDEHLDAASVATTLDGSPFIAGTPVTGEGSHTLHAEASDTFNNHSSLDVHFSLDLSGPQITISGVADGAWYSGAVSPSVSVADTNLDPASVQITLNGQPFVSGTAIVEEGYYLFAASASDTAGHSSQSAVSFALDLTPPQITVSSPAEQSVTKENPVALTGYIMDAHPESLAVNGEPAGSAGQSSFSVPVTLSEGANTISLSATDRAGNSATLEWHVTLKTTPPAVSITSPLAGSLTNLTSATVTGTVSSDAVSVEVNGRQASVASGVFTAYQVPLAAEGQNAITATAKDAAGNEGTAQLSLIRDTVPPAIGITAPPEGAHSSASSILVEGSIADASLVTATLNGEPLSLSQAGTPAPHWTFSAPVPLAEGTNYISIQAADAAGNASAISRAVVRESGGVSVTSMTPAPGSIGASATAPIRVVFSRAVLKSTVTAGSFQVSTQSGGTTVPLAGAVTGQDNVMTFLPQSAYPEGSTVQVSLASGITDLAGNALTPYTASFSTASNTGGSLSLTLDSHPALTNQSAVTISGMTAPGATVTVSSAGVSPAPLTTTAGNSGRFSASVPLVADTFNSFTVQASLSGQSGPVVPFGILHDGNGPLVVNCSTGILPALIIDFNEAISAQSATMDAVSLSANGAPVLCDLSLEEGGTRLRITPEEPVGTSPAVLAVSSPIADLAGNPMKDSFIKTFNGATRSDAFLLGEVYDDVTGLPLGGASVSLWQAGTPAPQAVSGGYGAWALGVANLPSGSASPLSVHISASGYSDAHRQAEAAAGEIKATLDARLTPLSQEIRTVGAAGGSAVFAGGTITVSIPENTLPDNTSLRVTVLSSQGLPFPLPAGFSPACAAPDAAGRPLCAYRIDLVAQASLPADISLSVIVPAPAGAGISIPAASFDPEQLEWVGLAPAASDGAHASLSVEAQPPGQRPGQALARSLSSAAITFVLLRPDTEPLSAPEVIEGQTLSGLTGYALDAASATLAADPPVILPSQKARASVEIVPPAAAPSGLPFQVTFTESLDLRGGDIRAYNAYTCDLFAYQKAGTASLESQFPVSPFPGIDVLTLLEGRIALSVGAYQEETTGGGIYDPASPLSVSGPQGTGAEIPAGASASTIPVRVFPVSEQSLLAPVPQGFTYLGGAELFLGGGSLTQPAVLSIDKNALAAGVTSNDTVILAQYKVVSGVAGYLLADIAFLDSATGRLRTLSGNVAQASLPANLLALTWPSVVGEGRYVFLKAAAPIGFAKGLVLDGQSPVSGALAGAVPAASPSPSGVGAPPPGQSPGQARRDGRLSPVIPADMSPPATTGGGIQERPLWIPGQAPNDGGGTGEPAPQRARNDSQESISSASSAFSAVNSPYSSRLESLIESGAVPEEALLILDMTGVNAVTGQDGSYLIPVIPSLCGAGVPACDLRAVSLSTGDQGQATATIPQTTPPAIVIQDIPLQVEPLAVTSTFPANGAQNVSVGTEIVANFNKPVSPASLDSTTFSCVAQASGAGFQPALIPGSLRLLAGGTSAAFTSAELLPAAATITVTIGGVTDRSGRSMQSPYSFSFTTTTPPVTPLDPGKMEARLPDADGYITITGGAGAVEGNAVIYVINATHPEYPIAAGEAGDNGSFSLSIRGAIGDRIELHVFGIQGERVYTFEQLVSEDGLSSSMGPAGGTFTADVAGQSVTLVVPEGAFDEPVTLSLKPVTDQAQVAPVPDGILATAPVSFEIATASGQPGFANKEIDFFLGAPQNLDPNKQYWLVKTVTWGADAKKSPMVIDTMRRTPCPGGPGECLATNSPPFPGLRENSILQLYQQDPLWGFATGQLSTASMSNEIVAWSPSSPYVFLTDIDRIGATWLLPLPPLAPPNGYPINFQDSLTHEIVVTITRMDPPSPGSVSDLGIVGAGTLQTEPYLMDSTPFSSLPFQIRPQVLGDATASELAITIYFAKDRSWPAMPPATTVPAGPNAVMTAPAGTTGTDGILRVDIESPPDGNGQTTILSGFVPLQPDGSVNLRLDQVSQELRSALWSGGKIIVTYPLAAGGSAAAAVTIPEREITGDLYLRIHGGALWIAAVRRESPPGSGSYTGFGGPGQEGVWPPPRFTLYDAMRRDASIAPEIGAAEVNCALGFEFSIDAFRQVFSSDILYYTLSASSIDPGASISVTMDSPLQIMPVEVEGSAAPNSVSQQPSIRLVKRESEFDPWFGVGITLKSTPDGPHPRVIEVVPSGGLEPGATYELRLENMIGVHISDSAPRRVVAGRFTVRASEILSDVPYAAMYDMVRRGNLLYVAAGEAVDSADPDGQTSRGFFDILDMSDPSSPLRLSQGEPCDPATQNCASGSCCPQNTLGWARGVAIAENLCSNCGVPSQNDPAPEDAELHTTAAVVGGGGVASGFVALFKADYVGPEETDPPIVPGSDPPVTAFEPVPREEPKVGSYLGGTMVSWPIGSIDRYPVGVPQAVKVTNGLVGPDGRIVVEETTNDDGVLTRKRVSPPRAFVSTLGAGLVQVNLDRVGPDNIRATEFILPSFQAPYTGPGGITVSGGTGGETDSEGFWPSWPHDISSAVRGMGMFTYNMGPYLNPPVPTDTRSFLLAAVDHLGLVAWDVTRQTQLGPTPVGIGPFMKAPASPWLEHKAAAPGWADPDDAVARGDLTGGNGFWAPARTPATPLASFLTGGPAPPENPVYHVAPVPTGAMRVQVYPGYNCLDARGEEYQTTIALVAGGQAGVLVYEVYPEYAVYPQGNDPVRDPDDEGLAPATKPFMELRAIIPVSWTSTRDPGDTHAGIAYDVVLDTRRRLAYVADFSDSVVVLDMKEPFRTPAALLASGYSHGPISSQVEGFFTAHPPYECISRLDKDGDSKDDRIVGTIPLCPVPVSGCSSRSTLILDSDTGLLYVGASGPIDTDPSTSGGGLKTVGANDPRMEFLLDDTSHPGQLKAPGYLSAFDGDKPRLGMWVQGGVGAVNAFTGRGEISADIALIDRLGFRETEQVIGQNLDGSEILAPSSTVARQVTLTRQSLKKTDPKYNFFLQEWNAPGTQVPDPNQKVQLAMMYSQTDPNTPADPTFTPAWLMTSKQSGSIRGSVYLGSASTIPAYLRNRTILKESKVARPWVEWTGDVLVEQEQEERGESAQEDASLFTGILNYQGPQAVAVGQPRDITFDYKDQNPYDPLDRHYLYPGTLQFVLSRNNLIIEPRSATQNGMLLVESFTRGCKVRINGIAEPPAGELSPQTDIIVALNLGDGRRKFIDTFPITVFSAGIAVDYNRDGFINFGDGLDPTGSGHTDVDIIPQGESFEFWLNDNYTFQDIPPQSDSAFAKYYQDEKKDNQVAVPTGDTVGGVAVTSMENWADCQYDQIRFERDLEDFAMLFVRKAPSYPGIPTNFQYQFSFKPGSADDPSVKIFRAAVPNDPESLAVAGEPYDSYLGAGTNPDPSDATAQLGSRLCGIAKKSTAPMDGVTLAPYQVVSPGRTVPFLFEGVTRGKGTFRLRIFSNGVLFAKYELPMDLEPIGEFVEEYTVEQPGDPDVTQDQDPLQQAVPFLPHAPRNVHDDANHNYILWVHGWNWADWQKQQYGYSTFKRLYWLGYKGRFGIFRWPGTYGTPHGLLTFDDSERHALLSGAPLKDLIENLAEVQQFKVHIYAHSQGCMATSEALREIANPLNPTERRIVESMTFSQAAVSARMYQKDYPAYTENEWWQLIDNITRPGIVDIVMAPFGPDIIARLAFAYQPCPIPAGWPDLHGHFPIALERGNPTWSFEQDYEPYFAYVKLAVREGRMFNFFNQYDYPTGQWTPDAGISSRGSGAYLINQLVKQFRRYLPCCHERDYVMFFDGEYTGESRMYFYRNEAANRVDRYYVAAREDYDCITGKGIPLSPDLYDFTSRQDKFKMIAYGCSSYSLTLGGHRPDQHLASDSGFLDYTQNEVDMERIFSYRHGTMWHGAQFRGSLAQQRAYWVKFLENIGITAR